MKKRIAVTVTALLGLLLSPLAVAAQAETPSPDGAEAATGLHVSDGRLVEGNGSDFVMRGVNHAHTWYPSETGSLADIKSLGANTVRVVLSSGDRWTKNDTADVRSVVDQCKANRVICVLEVHDTTGYGDQDGATTLARAVDYWLSVQSALTGEEDYVVVNIGNEPFGNNNASQWTADTKAAIAELRDGGFDHALMVDAPNWGQDWSGTMRDNAASVFASDPDRNTVFSIHMYGVYDTAAEIRSYLGAFVSSGLPLVVGEFGHDHSDGNPDEDTIFSETRALGLGYLGWSWSGNSADVGYLDMANGFDAGSLTSWGRRIFNGADGIAQTAEEATVYSGSGEDPGPSPDPEPDADCAVGYQVTSHWNDGFQGKVTVRNTGSSAIDGWSLEWTFPSGQSVTAMWGGTADQSGADVTVTSVSWTQRIAAGSSIEIGFTGRWNGSNNSPTAFALNEAACTVG
ncbi:MAG TPA: mannan endo-1,4-beta-mannosidase [Streptomyces sp.]|nr:mannan endo-1,4-beta-mannosidase [Streptomyces sp.]